MCGGLFCFRGGVFVRFLTQDNLEIIKGKDLAKSLKLVFDLKKKKKAGRSEGAIACGF